MASPGNRHCAICIGTLLCYTASCIWLLVCLAGCRLLACKLAINDTEADDDDDDDDPQRYIIVPLPVRLFTLHISGLATNGQGVPRESHRLVELYSPQPQTQLPSHNQTA